MRQRSGRGGGRAPRRGGATKAGVSGERLAGEVAAKAKLDGLVPLVRREAGGQPFQELLHLAGVELVLRRDQLAGGTRQRRARGVRPARGEQARGGQGEGGAGPEAHQPPGGGVG